MVWETIESWWSGVDPLFVHGFSTWAVLQWIGLGAALFVIPTVLINRRDRPMAALVWIILLVELPIFGIFFWWVFGLTHMKRRRRKRTKAVQQIARKLAHLREVSDVFDEEATSVALDLGEEVSIDRELVRGVFPPTSHNAVRVLSNGADSFNAFEEAVRSARHHVHFEFYIWQSDKIGTRFRDLLIEAAERGVEVRALYDGIGGAPVHGRFMKPLVAAGGQAAPFLPVSFFERRLRINFRNHRKIIVVDGHVGFTGGLNLADEYLEWEDAAFRFEGPVVRQIQEVFAEDWYFATGENLAHESYFDPSPDDPAPGEADVRALASGPDLPGRSIHKAFFLAITNATERVWLTTPYFVPDAAIDVALQTAALRGIDVRIVVPGPGASDVRIARIAGRSFFDELLGAGVRIFEYEPRILHAKGLIVDDEWAFLGSANLDLRSFRLNFEMNCLIRDRALNAELARGFEGRCADSREVEPDAFRRRPHRAKVLEGGARLFSPLL